MRLGSRCLLSHLRSRSGQGIVEYALSLGAFALVIILSLSVLGRKEVDVLGMALTTMPGAHPSDSQPMGSASLLPVANSNGTLRVDIQAVTNSMATNRLGGVFGDADLANVIIETRVD